MGRKRGATKEYGEEEWWDEICVTGGDTKSLYGPSGVGVKEDRLDEKGSLGVPNEEGRVKDFRSTMTSTLILVRE